MVTVDGVIAMDFQFSEEEKLLQWAVNDFAQKALSDEQLHSADHVPLKIIANLGKLGFLGIKVPEQYGGEQGTWVDVGILGEEIAKRNIAVAHLAMRSYEIAAILAKYGTDRVKTEWLTKLAKGRKVGCIAATESVSGSDIAAIKAHVKRKNNSYFISAEKSPVSFGMQADFAIVFAKTARSAGRYGLSAFLVPLDLPGITKASVSNMGLHGAAIGSILFEQVEIPIDYRIGEEGQAFDIHKQMGFSSGLHQILTAIIPLGACQAALNLAVSYSKERVAFGRPLAKFQAISGKIAEDITQVEAARWLCYRALWLKEQNFPYAKEAAMCSWWCPQIACRVIKNSLLIHGHTGYSDDFPLERMLRDVTAFRIMGGADQMMKLIIASKSIGKIAVPDEFAVYMNDGASPVSSFHGE